MRTSTTSSRRRRASATLAALALATVSVFGGSSSAMAAPPAAPTIDSFAPTSMDATELLTGSVTATGGGIDMVVEVYNPLVDPTNPVCVDTIPTLQLPGGWGCNVPLADGYNEIYVISWEDDGLRDELSPPSNTVVVGRGGVQPPVVITPVDNDTVVDYTPVFTGTGPVLGSIVVNGGPTPPICAANVDEFGDWSCEATAAIPPDTYGYSASATRADGSGGGFTGILTLTIAPPEPTVSYDVSPAAVTATSVGEPSSGVSVELYSVIDTGDGYQHTIVDGCPTLIDTLPINHETAYGGPVVSCPFADLSPGIWNVYSGQVVGGIYSNFRSDYFRVPTTPTIDARVNADRSVTIDGTGQAGGIVQVQTPGGTNVCQSPIVGTAWSCTVAPPAGLHSYVAYSEDQGFVAMPNGETANTVFLGQSALSGEAQVTVPLAPAAPPPPPAPEPPTAPQPPAPPVVRPPSIVVPAEAVQGDQILVEGTDAPAGATADIEIHSDPVHLATTVVESDGTFSLLVTVPEDTEPGDHHIVTVFTPVDGGAPSTVEQPITVAAAPVAQPVEEAVAPTTVKKPTAVANAVPVREEPGAPSALTAGFIRPADIIANPVVAATAGSIGLALVLLVLVPAEFFGESLANHYSTFAAFLGRRKRLARVTSALGQWIGAHRLFSGIALVLLTSAVFSFVDPGFGFDLTSLRLLLSCAASILLVNFASAGITELVAERAWGVPTRLKIMPWGLFIAIAAVLASRLLNFSPGFLIGSIIGVGIIGAVGARLEARVILLWCSVVWGIAVGSWALIGTVPVLPASDPAAFWTALLTDSLVATSAAGLTALVVALLPIALFDGGELFAYSKWQWGVAFGVAVTTFCLIVVPSASNWMGLGDGLLGWMLLTLGFVALAIVAYVLARRRSSTKRSRLLTAA